MSDWEIHEREARVSAMARQMERGADPRDVAEAWPDATSGEVEAARKRARRGLERC